MRIRKQRLKMTHPIIEFLQGEETRKSRFNMNKSRNRSKKYHKNLDNEARQKLCKAVKKMRIIREDVDDEAKEKWGKSDQREIA